MKPIISLKSTINVLPSALLEGKKPLSNGESKYITKLTVSSHWEITRYKDENLLKIMKC